MPPVYQRWNRRKKRYEYWRPVTTFNAWQNVYKDIRRIIVMYHKCIVTIPLRAPKYYHLPVTPESVSSFMDSDNDDGLLNFKLN